MTRISEFDGPSGAGKVAAAIDVFALPGTDHVRKCPEILSPETPSEVTDASQPDGRPLDAAQARAVELLGAGCSIGHAAKSLQIDPRTLYRWRQEPAFIEALRSASRVRDREVRRIARAALAKSLVQVVDQLHSGAGLDAAKVLLRNRHLWRFAEMDGRW